MFEFVRRHNKLFQGALLVLIVPSFVAFGVQGYQRFSEGEGELAKVDGRSISRTEFDSTLRNQIERIQAQMPGIEPGKLDTPLLRQRVLDDLVRQHVLFSAASGFHLTPSDARLDRLFKTDPQFESLRNADGSLRREVLQARGMTPTQFEAQLRQDLALQQVMAGVSSTGFGPRESSTLAANAFFQRREIEVARFAVQDQRAGIRVSDAEVAAYYEAPTQQGRWLSPESVDVEYLLLDAESVTRSVTLDEQELRKYYEENRARFGDPEERRVRHILVKVEAGASADAKAKAKAQADEILASVGQDRASFAAVAKAKSQDPGSAAQGGDLDWVARGAMVKPFEDAAFALKKGELGAVVETEFGYHVLEVTDVRGGTARPFDAVRAQIEGEVRQQLARQRFAEAAEQFTNLVEQEDQLQPVADKLKIAVRRVQGLTRSPQGEGGMPVERLPKFLEAVFSSENLDSRRNSEPIDLGSQQLLAVHVLKHHKAARMPLAQVQTQVREALVLERASTAAKKAGQAALADAQAGKAVAFGSAVMVSRQQASQDGLAPKVVEAALRMNATKVPALEGVDLGSDGYAVVRVTKVLEASPDLMKDLAKLQSQYGALWTDAESRAYDAALHHRFKALVKGASVVNAAAKP